MLNAYASMEPDSQQYLWLQSELASVDRRITPWVLVTIHVPMYNTFAIHRHDLQHVAMKEHFEPLFVNYTVNVVFTGHVHAYQRTHSVAFDQVVKTGPMHITVGAGGRECKAKFHDLEPESWLATRDATTFGYGRFQVFNATHAEWKWHHLSQAHRYNTIQSQDDIELPPLEHDRLIVNNQYHLQ